MSVDALGVEELPEEAEAVEACGMAGAVEPRGEVLLGRWGLTTHLAGGQPPSRCSARPGTSDGKMKWSTSSRKALMRAARRMKNSGRMSLEALVAGDRRRLAGRACGCGASPSARWRGTSPSVSWKVSAMVAPRGGQAGRRETPRRRCGGSDGSGRRPGRSVSRRLFRKLERAPVAHRQVQRGRRTAGRRGIAGGRPGKGTIGAAGLP